MFGCSSAFSPKAAKETPRYMAQMPTLSPSLSEGQRLSYGGNLCTVRYVGQVEGQGSKTYIGVEWDNDSRGKHNGTYNGKQYFKCLSPSPTAGSLVLLSGRKPDATFSFLEGIQQKYASEITFDSNPVSSNSLIQISGKVVEEVGFDKVREQLSKLDGLKNIILTDQRVGVGLKVGEDNIAAICPNIELIDLTRNLIDNFSEIVTICSNLPRLKTLKLNENRFRDLEFLQPESTIVPFTSNACDLGISKNKVEQYQQGLATIMDVEMQQVLLSWNALQMAMSFFISLKNFNASRNNLRSIPLCTMEFSTLTTLVLDHNKFPNLFSIMPLNKMQSLEILRLKGNDISTVGLDLDCPTTIRPFPLSLRYLDLSSNAVSDWDFVEALPSVFPGLRELRISDNPVYGNTAMSAGMNTVAEEAYMLTVALLADLESLNFSKISKEDRANAEMFFLSKIGKMMANVPEDQEHTITSKHKRYQALCEKYGPPTVVRQNIGDINPDFLEARLIKFNFYLPSDDRSGQPKPVWLTEHIPKSFDIYRVKGIVGQAFNIQPLKVRLIWETGEWDPVAGYEDEGETYDDENDVNAEALAGPENGRMVRREVELEDGTRQVGNWVDGSEATVRIEVIV